MNILVKWPTRSRPFLFLSTFMRWRKALSGRHCVRFLISIDQDDSAMTAPWVMGMLARMPDVTFAVGPAGRTKVEACNADLPPDGDFGFGGGPPDMLVLASDDMQPRMHGWDDIFAQRMAQAFPAMDGALHFADGYRPGHSLITLSVMGWNLFRRFGYVYHPAYRSFFCDNEFTAVVKAAGKYVTDSRLVISHDHIGRNPDALFHHNQRCWREDEMMFALRRAAGFDVQTPVLSILIASLERRRDSLRELLAVLHTQIFALENPWRVEIHVDRDAGELPVGEKRSRLLSMARGQFICFIDDDDLVMPGYVADILAAVAAQPQADCVVFAGRLEVDGVFAGPFDYSIAHQRYYQLGNRYFRTPNHLCPVRRDLARRIGFKSINCGEDTDYARRLFPLLKTEAVIPDPALPGEKKTLYRYRVSPAGTATQRTGAGNRQAQAR